MVDSAHPPGAQAWKGTAVRSLRSYVSWVRLSDIYLIQSTKTTMTSTLQLLQRFTSEIIRGLRSIVMLPNYLHQVVIGQLLGDSHGSRSSATSNTLTPWGNGMVFWGPLS